MSSFLIFTVLTAITTAQRGDTRPNVVVFVMDDLPFLEQWEESAPKGNDLEGLTVSLDPYYTPRIDQFRTESVIFAKSYCAAPKCAPSRMCMLTGRQALSCEYAIDSTLNTRGLNTGVYGTGVTVLTMKMQGKDAEYNMPQMLRDHGYYTGFVGKWHMMPNDNMGHPELDCKALATFPNANTYSECKDILKDVGFDFIDGFYFENIMPNDYFSHNPEWMVNEAAKFVQEAVDRDEPFFLYFASTLTHSPDADVALAKYGPEDTPKGKLSGSMDNPEGKTSMDDRATVLAEAKRIAQERGLKERNTAAIYWADMQFGAMLDTLQRFDVYDDTYIVFQSDHGQVAKGLMYEQGTRIINFHRYPPLYGKNGPMITPPDFVTSNIDVAASIFQLAGVSLPREYQLDGEPFLDDVVKALRDPSFDQVADGDSSCRFKFMDIKNSYSMASGSFQYIFRATNDVETLLNVDRLYPYCHDTEQLYDLEKDPSQKKNLFNNVGDMMMHSEVISEFQTIMREYIDLHCIASNGAQCVKPDLLFGMTGGGYFADGPETTSTTKAPVMCFADVGAGNECCHDRDCDGDQTCDTGYCVDPPCNCRSDEICVSGACVPFEPPTTTAECTRDGDCRTDETCFMEQCIPVMPPPATTARVTVVGPPADLCTGVTCRGSQVCVDGVCQRPSRNTDSSGSSGSSSDGQCSSDSDCRGTQVCNSGSCERMSSGSSGSTRGSSGSSGSTRGSGESRGGGRGGIKSVKSMESLAFNDGLVVETKTNISFNELMAMKVNVSTVLMFALMAMAVWFGTICFQRANAKSVQKKGDGESSYGAV